MEEIGIFINSCKGERVEHKDKQKQCEEKEDKKKKFLATNLKLCKIQQRTQHKDKLVHGTSSFS